MTTPTRRTAGKAAKASGKRAPRTPSAKTSAAKSPPRAKTSGTRASARASTQSGTRASSRGKPSGAKAQDRRTGAKGGGHAHPHDVTITLPVERAADAAKKAVAVPVTTAQRVLPAKGGLPLYMGLGALGVVGVLDWPVALGIGVGYAVLRRGGAVGPSDGDADGRSGRATA